MAGARAACHRPPRAPRAGDGRDRLSGGREGVRRGRAPARRHDRARRRGRRNRAPRRGRPRPHAGRPDVRRGATRHLRRPAVRPRRRTDRERQRRAPDRAVPRRLLVLAAEARSFVHGHVYPVPDPAFPFLGVHFTRRLDGEVWAGPNAVPSLARERYRRLSFQPRDAKEMLGFGGLWRLAGRHAARGWPRSARDVFPRAALREMQRYIPALERRHIRLGPSGIRAQVLSATARSSTTSSSSATRTSCTWSTRRHRRRRHRSRSASDWPHRSPHEPVRTAMAARRRYRLAAVTLDLKTTTATTWWRRAHGDDARDLLVAYFSMEFGLESALPIYSGGLGVLAGDHLKAAADLGIPLVGVGLLYRGGYFRQGVDEQGRQTERYQPVDPAAAGLVREPVTVEVDLQARRSPPRCGARTSARCRSTCSRSTGSPTRCTAATASTASARSCCSEWAASARSRRSASSPPSST